MPRCRGCFLGRAVAVRRVVAVDTGVAVTPATRRRRHSRAWFPPPGRRQLRHGEVDLGAESWVLNDHLLGPPQAAVALRLLRMLCLDTVLLREAFKAFIRNSALLKLRRHLVDIHLVVCFVTIGCQRIGVALVYWKVRCTTLQSI